MPVSFSTFSFYLLIFAAVFTVAYLFCYYVLKINARSNSEDRPATQSGQNWLVAFIAAFVFPSLLVIINGKMLYLAFPAGVLAAVLGYFVPLWLLRYRAKKRMLAFNEQILDLVVELASCLRAGAGIPQALETVIRDIGGVASEELSVILDDYRLGMPLSTAFSNLCKRLPNEDLKLLTAGLRVAVETGGSFADILDKISQTIRSRRDFQQKLDGMIAQGQFEALAIAMMPLLAFAILYLIQPDLMRLLIEKPAGWCALGVVVILELVGFLVLKQVTNVEP